MKGKRNNRGKKKYITLEEAIEFINRTVQSDVQHIVKTTIETLWKQEEERR